MSSVERTAKRHLLASGMVVAAVALAAIGVMRGPRTAVADDAAPKPLYDKHAPVDPVKTNGAIFVDWPKPDAVLLFTGEQDGYLEPCGCAGLAESKGRTQAPSHADQGTHRQGLAGGAARRGRAHQAVWHADRNEVRLRAQGARPARLQGSRFRRQRSASSTSWASCSIRTTPRICSFPPTSAFSISIPSTAGDSK